MSLPARIAAVLVALPSALVAVPTAAAAPGPNPTPATSGPVEPSPTVAASPARAGSRVVAYRGVQAQVPASWAVVDLDRTPGACVRLDRPTVYLGALPAEQRCPARAVGRAETVWLGPTTPAEGRDAARVQAAPSARGGVSARVLDLPGGGERVAVTGTGVSVRTTWAADDARTRSVLASIRLQGPTTATTSTTMSASTSPAPTTAAATTVLTTAAATAPYARKAFTGMAFDTCAAPSTGTMSAWRSSPYSAVGIYIGGSMRACGDGNLSASWVDTVSQQGWGLLPIWVGPQAPCVIQSGLATISTTPSTAASQGRSNASSAAARARYFGLPAGSVVYYDMENYATGRSTCTTAVTTFLDAWTEELHRQGYTSGVYGNGPSVMADLSRLRTAGATWFTQPDQVWFARWNYIQTTSYGSTTSDFKDTYWADHQRVKQYRGDFTETWGGRSIAIDANWADARLPGNPTPRSYGTRTLGPGSAGFILTGDMRGWRPAPGSGRLGIAYMTGTSSSTTEYNGATWTPSLPTAAYAVDAYVPSSGATGVARYTLTGAKGTKVVGLDQARAAGQWRPLAVVVAGGGRPVSLHLGDNAMSASGYRVAADAARFRPVAYVPGAPTAASAAPSDANATVTWLPAAPNGSTVSSYTVTASPGGRSVTVPGTARTATVAGLTNDTAYTFTVRAANYVGTGPLSQPTAAVTPLTAGVTVAVAPQRLLDTRTGTRANPALVGRLGPGQTVSVAIAGAAGSPVPADASAVYLNLVALGASSGGGIRVVGDTSVSMWYPALPRATGYAMAATEPGGRVRLTNVSSGSVDLVAEVQGYVRPGTIGPRERATNGARLLDTRVGTLANPRRTALAPGESVTVRAAGVAGSPIPAGASSTSLKTLVLGPAARGSLVLTADGGQSTTIGFDPVKGAAWSNRASVRLGANGTFRLRNTASVPVHVLVATETYAAGTGALVTPVRPTHVMDTRVGNRVNPRTTRLAAGEKVGVKVAGVLGSPVPAGARTVTVRLSAFNAARTGYLASIVGSARTLHTQFASGRSARILAAVPVASDGTIRVGNSSSGTVDLTVDVLAYAR